RTIVWVPLALIGLFILRGLGDFTQTYFMGYVGRRIVSQLRREVFRHILHLPIGYFDRSSSAALLSRLTYNTAQIGQASTDWLIKVYNAEEPLGRQFDAVNDGNLRSNMKLVLTKGVSNPTVQLVTVVGLAFVLSIAIADAVHARMSMGDLLGFLTALVSIAQPLRELVGVAGPLQQGIAAGQSLFELLDEPQEPQGGSWRVARVRGAVQFDHVSFAYAGAAAAQAGEPRVRERAAALTDVSLQVAAGESLAIVGRSGSGKSTLVNLL